MIRRALVLLVFGSALGLVFATLLVPQRASGGEVPRELKSDPPAPTVKSSDLSRPFVEATKRARPAVVRIQNYGRDWRGNLRVQSSGSGFIVSKQGHILTNRHVVHDAQLLAVLLPDGRRVTRVTKIGEDARSDVAVIQLRDIDKLTVATLGDSDHLEVGEWVIAIGAPFELESSVSAGIVSATGRTRIFKSLDATQDFIQTDAALNPGNSGGPLINLDGHVVGINTAIGGAETSAGVGFAIPINLARTVAIALIETGVAKRGYLGIGVNRLDKETLRKIGIDGPGALSVLSVEQGSAAAEGGLKVDDVLVEADGRPLRDEFALRAELAAAGPGGKVSFKVWREGKIRTAIVVLGEEPVYSFGLEVQELDGETRKRAGLSLKTQGVVITRVQSSSPALLDPKNPLLYPGDVIVALARPRKRPVAVRSVKEFQKLLMDLQTYIQQRGPVNFILESEGRRYRVLLRKTTGSRAGPGR